MADEWLRHLLVSPHASILDAFAALEQNEQGIVFVCDEDARVLGTLTDGDLRRALLAGARLDSRILTNVMNPTFVSVEPMADRAFVLDTMLARKVQQIPIVDTSGRLAGLHTMRQIIGAVPRANCAVIMAGGKGTRLRPYTENVPKPMVRVAGRPMIERLVLHLVGHGIRRIYISVNYLSDMVERHFGDGSSFGCSISYLHEDRPLGSGGALALLPKDITEPLLVMNGDLVTQIDVGRFIEFHSCGGFVATMGLHGHAIPLPFGVADVQGTRLTGIREKPTEQFLINAGLYVLSPVALTYVRADEEGEFPITDLFRACMDAGLPVGAYFIEEDWMDVGRPDDLKRANGR
jgi:dTDP-glucose pyrophosphorylase